MLRLSKYEANELSNLCFFFCIHKLFTNEIYKKKINYVHLIESDQECDILLFEIPIQIKMKKQKKIIHL